MTNPYIRKQGGRWVIIQKRAGKVLSHHASREKAEEAFRAMESGKHGGHRRGGGYFGGRGIR